MIESTTTFDRSGFEVGRILKGVGGQYEIATSAGATVVAVPRGIFRKDGIRPTVGDKVRIEPSGDPDIPFVIADILERKNLLIRPPVANIDILVLTFSVSDPKPDLALLDKLLILTAKQKIRPIIWLTKSDLDPGSAKRIGAIYSEAGYTVILSGRDDAGDFERERETFAGAVVGFAGQSGVGKSTLCNLISGIEGMEVGMISDRLKRGKHTTRHVELVPFAGGYLIDTPGFSSLELLDIGITVEDVPLGYPELASVGESCRFADCLHTGELGCAIATCKIDPDRLSRYREFIRTLQEHNPYSGKKGERK